MSRSHVKKTVRSDDAKATPVGSSDRDLEAFITKANGTIQAQADEYVAQLGKAIEIPSVSLDFTLRERCLAMAHWIVGFVEKNGGTANKVDVGYQQTEDGTRHELPPVILAEFRSKKMNAKNLPTLLIYSHYDVAPVDDPSKWKEDPFKLRETDDERIFGRGASSCKGPLLSCIWAAGIFKQLGKSAPINVKFLLEGMAESNSECIEELVALESKPNGFLSDIDYICLSKFSWLTVNTPSIITSLCGSLSGEISITREGDVVHSGDYGGLIHEPLIELTKLLGSLTDDVGNVVIEGGNSMDDEVIRQARDEVKSIDLDVDKWKALAGDPNGCKGENSKLQFVLNRAYKPTLSVHCVDSCNIGARQQPLIPQKASAKFYIRVAPGEDVDDFGALCGKHLKNTFSKMKSTNDMEITINTTQEFIANQSSLAHRAATAAIKKLFDQPAHLIRCGSSNEIAHALQKELGADLLILPLSGPADNIHGDNESIERSNYVEGALLMVTFFEELGRLARKESLKSFEREDEMQSSGLVGRLKGFLGAT